MKSVLLEQLKRVKINSDEKRYLLKTAGKIIEKIEENLKKRKIDANVFIGGSLAKDTILKKDIYDVDLFIKFSKNYSEEVINRHMNKLFFWFKIAGLPLKIKKMHGSRDYYQIMLKEDKNIIIEVVPSLKINKPEEARNVTDLSYFHIKYVKNMMKKNKNLADEIILAKSFCHAQRVYGAESYVKGFSGYALELLICHYGSFIKFLNEVVNSHDKIIIDPGKNFKNKEEIINYLNESKKLSPIIIIDPTFKERNASSSLSEEAFERFKVSAKAFLENPSVEFFEVKKVVVNDLIRKAKIEEGEFISIELRTNKQEGDIAGTKLLKFSKILTRELSRSVDILEDHFDYSGGKKAIVYYVLRNKNELVISGPLLEHKEAVENFKKVHPIWYIEDKRIKCAVDNKIKGNNLIKEFVRKNKKQLREMSIKGVRIK